MMKSVIDIYLKNQGLARDDVTRRGGFSARSLTRINKQDPERLPITVLEPLARATGVSTQELRTKLVAIRDGNTLYIATQLDELKQKVQDKETQFLVEGELVNTIREIKKGQISDMVENFYNFGSGAFGDTAAYLCSWVFVRINKKMNNNTEKLKLTVLQQYAIEINNHQQARLYLKSLKY